MIMSKEIIERIEKLTSSDSNDEKQQLQIEIYHLVVSSKFDNDVEVDLHVKNTITKSVNEFVKNSDEDHKQLVIENLKYFSE